MYKCTWYCIVLWCIKWYGIVRYVVVSYGMVWYGVTVCHSIPHYTYDRMHSHITHYNIMAWYGVVWYYTI
jgi:hypothetical protein